MLLLQCDIDIAQLIPHGDLGGSSFAIRRGHFAVKSFALFRDAGGCPTIDSDITLGLHAFLNEGIEFGGEQEAARAPRKFAGLPCRPHDHHKGADRRFHLAFVGLTCFFSDRRRTLHRFNRDVGCFTHQGRNALFNRNDCFWLGGCWRG